MKAVKEKRWTVAPFWWLWLFLLAAASTAFTASARPAFLAETRVGASQILQPCSSPEKPLQTLERQWGDGGFSGENALDGRDPVNRIDPSGNMSLVGTLNTMAIKGFMWASSATRTARAFRWGLMTLNAVAFVNDPGAYVSMGPLGAGQVLAADLAQMARAGGSLFRATRSAWAARNIWGTLQGFRADMNLPQLTEAGGNKVTTALLEIDDGVWIGSRYMGSSPNNRAGLHPSLRPNAQTGTHAEANVFNQAAWAGSKSDRATLYVDRDLCKACGQNGGVKSMAKALGIRELTIVTQSGREVIVIDASINPATQVPSPVGLILEVLQAGD